MSILKLNFLNVKMQSWLSAEHLLLKKHNKIFDVESYEPK
jgi:hypothetical protein